MGTVCNWAVNVTVCAVPDLKTCNFLPFSIDILNETITHNQIIEVLYGPPDAKRTANQPTPPTREQPTVPSGPGAPKSAFDFQALLCVKRGHSHFHQQHCTVVVVRKFKIMSKIYGQQIIDIRAKIFPSVWHATAREGQSGVK